MDDVRRGKKLLRIPQNLPWIILLEVHVPEWWRRMVALAKKPEIRMAVRRPRTLAIVTALLAIGMLRRGSRSLFSWLDATFTWLVLWLADVSRAAESFLRAQAPYLRAIRFPSLGAVPARQRFAALLSVAALMGILTGIVVPVLQVVGEARNLLAVRSLSASGLKHLMDAKADLDASGLSATLAGILDGQHQPAGTPPYTLLVQRQGGMYYGVTVAVQPSPSLARQSVAPVRVSTTGTANMPIQLGAPPSSPATMATPSGPALPDSKLVAKVRADVVAAQYDFAALDRLLNGGDMLLAGAGLLPGLSGLISGARALADTGYQLTTLAAHALAFALPVLDRLHSGSLGPDTPLLSAQDFAALRALASEAQQVYARVTDDLAQVNLSSLPLKQGQKVMLAQARALLPRLAPALRQAPQWVDAIGWLLGMSQARRFLVQTLDRAELRPTGGFTGDWAVLTVDHGRVGKLTFNDVSRLDYGGNDWVIGRRPPDQYSWWPFYNWGVRDANLSPDFPTSANLIMDAFQKEGEEPVDGVIQISPLVVEHILSVIGPIYVPLYNDTITAQNLETKLHYYQLDKTGRQISARLQPGNTATTPRKRFTGMLGSLLQDKVRSLPQAQLMAVVKSVFEDWKAKDLQIYVKQSLIERSLAEHHLASSVDTTPTQDGFLFVQTNVVAAKTATMVDVAQNDRVTLDDQGGATHHLVITMAYHPSGNLYGYATYRAYARIYVPPQAQLKSGDGFDTDVPMCYMYPPTPTPEPTPPEPTPTPKHDNADQPTPEPSPTPKPVLAPAKWASLPPCPAVPYPASELSCPLGGYAPGARPPSIYGSDGYTPWANTVLGAPTARTSDLPDRVMWGGFVTIPPACTATLTLDYYVPHVVRS